MRKSIKHFVPALLLVMSGCGAVQAAAPASEQVTGTVSLQGGGTSNIKWTAPTTSTYKVHVFTPKNAATANALYRVYPNGKRASSNSCLATDPKYPCYEIAVDQTQAQNAWTQLMLNGDPETRWDFVQSRGYVTLVTSNLAATELLSVTALARFENRTIAIGKTYEGGIVFYVDDTGSHGLVAAPSDQGTGIQWYNGSYIFTGATGIFVGTGNDNTNKIVKVQGAGTYAAKLAADLVLNGYDDWFLPSQDELNLMYTNIGRGAPAPLTNVGGFAKDYYASSSETGGAGAVGAWFQNFNGGMKSSIYKNLTASVRAVRAF